MKSEKPITIYDKIFLASLKYILIPLMLATFALSFLALVYLVFKILTGGL